MEIILGILVAIFAVVAFVVLTNANKKDKKSETRERENPVKLPVDGCCGAHEVCEFDKLKMDETVIEYFDDEELDAYKNVNENLYTNDQIDQFRDVLYTLKTDEIKNWLLSLERREVQLPIILKSEARMLMAE